jgi:hypothetical protein
MSLFHSVKSCSPPLSYGHFPESYAIFLEHVATFFAFEAQSLFFSGFGEFALKRVLLSAVPLFFPLVMAFTLSKRPSFSCLVQTYSVRLMSFALWTVRADLFGNIHH